MALQVLGVVFTLMTKGKLEVRVVVAAAGALHSNFTLQTHTSLLHIVQRLMN